MKNYHLFILISLTLYSLLSHKAYSNPEKATDTYSQNLTISIKVDENTIDVEDEIEYKPDNLTDLVIRLNPDAKISSIKRKKDSSWSPVKFDQEFDKITIKHQTDSIKETLKIVYTLVLPQLPKGNQKEMKPDFSDIGSYIAKEGSFLSEASLWYPVLVGNDYFKYQINVITPKGQIPVTSGSKVEEILTDNLNTKFDFPYNTKSIPLVVGPYKVNSKLYKDFKFNTYFYPDEISMADNYLNSVEGYIDRYEKSIGEYPFKEFSIVSNILPTGLGFPSFTLIGNSILKLPFIVSTSLGHEILHNWWGNSVYPDYAQGNWSEGLTMYMADYAYSEDKGFEAAKLARRQAILNYLSFVNKSNAVPVTSFISRSETHLKAIGYDKVSMIFHMLRKEVGDDNFYSSIKKLYKEYKFKTASWNDIKNIFETESNKRLDDFFFLWIETIYMPKIKLADIDIKKREERYEIRFTVEQGENIFPLKIPLKIYFKDDREDTKYLRLDSREETFVLRSMERPLSLAFDEDFDIFRELYEEEIPATFNEVMGSEISLVIINREMDNSLWLAYEELLNRILKNPYIIISSPNEELIKNYRTVIIAGTPDRDLVDKYFINTDNWKWDEEKGVYAIGNQSIAGLYDFSLIAAKSKKDPKRRLLLLNGNSIESIKRVIRPLPHYGKYGYLAFNNGKNYLKGLWDVKKSPLIYRFKE